MEKIALISDSSCDLPKKIIEKYNIHIIPLHIIFKDRDYRDRVDITPQEFYERLETEIPSTSMPSMGEAWELILKLREEGYTHILAILISSGLSGTFSVFDSLKDKAKEIDISLDVINSKALSMALGFLVMRAAQLIQEKTPLRQIIDTTEELVKEARVFFVLKTLEYLRKGGRIGMVEGTIGNILDIKPIISINEEGVYYSVTKSRGWNRSLNKIVEIAVEAIGSRRVNLAVVHGEAQEEAEKVMEKLKNLVDIKESFIEQTTPSMGVHTGPGLLGITFCPA